MKKDQAIEENAEKYFQELANPESTEQQTDNTDDVTQFRDLPLASLPFGKFYHPGFRIQFRAALVEEIQHYSTIENDNPYDIRNKLDDILKACIKVELPNKKMGTYKDLKIGDRMYIIFTIREITFQKGPQLSLPVVCPKKKCSHNFNIELIRQNIELHDETEDVWKFYDPAYQGFVFNVEFSDQPFIIAPPSIGLQKDFSDWVQDKVFKKEEYNKSMVKIAPYMIGKNTVKFEEIDELNSQFDQIDFEEFQFLNDVVTKFRQNDFKLGVKGLVQKCPKCGSEVRTTNFFPARASDIFIIPNAFEHYLKK